MSVSTHTHTFSAPKNVIRTPSGILIGISGIAYVGPVINPKNGPYHFNLGCRGSYVCWTDSDTEMLEKERNNVISVIQRHAHNQHYGPVSEPFDGSVHLTGYVMLQNGFIVPSLNVWSVQMSMGPKHESYVVVNVQTSGGEFQAHYAYDSEANYADALGKAECDMDAFERELGILSA